MIELYLLTLKHCPERQAPVGVLSGVGHGRVSSLLSSSAPRPLAGVSRKGACPLLERCFSWLPPGTPLRLTGFGTHQAYTGRSHRHVTNGENVPDWLPLPGHKKQQTEAPSPPMKAAY